jgi:putative membrane protein
MMGHYSSNWNDMIGGWGFGWIFMIFFWLLIILGVFALYRYLKDYKQIDTGKKPIDILKGRYAKGEINKKEFIEIKKDLG